MTRPDYDRFRLRSFFGSLAQLGELETRSGSFRLADVGRVLEGNPKAVLFESAGAEGFALAGNVLGSRTRMAHAFGVTPRNLLAEVLREAGLLKRDSDRGRYHLSAGASE